MDFGDASYLQSEFGVEFDINLVENENSKDDYFLCVPNGFWDGDQEGDKSTTSNNFFNASNEGAIEGSVGVDYCSVDNEIGEESSTSINFEEPDLSCTEIKSPGGSKTVLWVPKFNESIEPKELMEFDTVEKGIAFYEYYAKRSGFDTRLGSVKLVDKEVVYRYVICTHAGKAKKSNVNTLISKKGKRKRKGSSQMIECPAKIGLKLINYGGVRFLVRTFEKHHNHELYTNHTVHMSRRARKLSDYEKRVIFNLNASNIGATKAHNIMTGLNGVPSYQGPKCTDYKKFIRDLNCHVGDSDASMIVDFMNLHVKDRPNFSFHYMVEDDEWKAMFWADSIAKRNYKEFSDIVSFDATFRTNMYNLVFVPFTGIDNHKKSVTFGAGLLAKETAEYYIWLLKCFLESFGKQSFIVVTDQDAAISKAVETVFNQSIHRLCMWHIGKKLSDKVLLETDFHKRLQRLIWNCCIDPNEFESTWISIIENFELEENNWLKDMFSIRSRWIPVFFKDMSLSGLMKTTSRSESENFFFQGFMSKNSNLVSFMRKFDAAMDKQRNIQLSNDFYCKNKSPVLETCLPFEVQASKFYTRTLFGIVQNELHDSLYSCSPGLFTIIDDREVCSVIEQPLGKYGKNRSTFFKQILRFDWDLNISEYEFKVNVYDDNETFKCSCMVFEHFGILCRHIFCIMKKKFMKEIPVKYLVRRWEKDIIHPEDLNNTSVGHNTGGCEKIVQDLYSIVAECISLVSHDSEALQEYVKWRKEMKEKIEQNPPKEDTRTKSELFDALIRVSKPAVNEIRNPENVRNKGCGGGKRLKSQKESALTEGRHCTFCNKLVLPSEKHDRRNCPLRKEKELEERLKKQNDLENAMDD